MWILKWTLAGEVYINFWCISSADIQSPLCWVDHGFRYQLTPAQMKNFFVKICSVSKKTIAEPSRLLKQQAFYGGQNKKCSK
uniref:Putative secreted protein n=1 Tax=Amblyomma cajennense TaxID=34607 RepID=A0A023FBA0_AMBCJ